jgi:hypothetical protein
VSYANQFQENQDKIYATIGDFRANYIHRIADKYPWLYWQAEAYQTTSNFSGLVLREQGGGAGLRAEVHPTPEGTLTLSLLPVYGEKRDFTSQSPVLPNAGDYILRASAGAEYRHKIGNYVEPGVKVYFQPQMLDFSQFRVYTETYVRLKLVHNGSKDGDGYIISEVNLVPKLIYWKSTDMGETLGDPVARLYGPSYFKFSNNTYGFVNLEFRFKM